MSFHHDMSLCSRGIEAVSVMIFVFLFVLRLRKYQIIDMSLWRVQGYPIYDKNPNIEPTTRLQNEEYVRVFYSDLFPWVHKVQ